MQSGVNTSSVMTGKHQTRQHLVENIRQPLFPLKTNDQGKIVAVAKHKSSFDNEEGNNIHKISNNVIDYNKIFMNNAINADANSIKTQAQGSNSSRTKDDEHEFDLSFEEDFFFDLQKGGIDLDE